MVQDKLKKFAQELYNRSSNNEDKLKYEIIIKILEDKQCFEKMKTETAYKLLADLSFGDEECRKIYDELILKKY